MSLTHYERYCANENEDDLKGFMLSIVQHIEDLSKKKYHENIALNAPDFTIMVMPIESAYFLAIRTDPDLYQQAWAKRIALCCPSTLLAMLQTIGHLWKMDMQNKNAEEIARNAINLAKKFYTFSESLDSIGTNLKKASDGYENARKQLVDGNGNLKARVEKLLRLQNLEQMYLVKKLL